MMNDYRYIRISPKYRKILPSYTVVWHRKSRLWLEKELKNCKGKKVVIITHHAPSILSVPDHYKNDHLSAAFASDMDDFIRIMGSDLWIHGHIHEFSDYSIGTTRVLCNPRGYPHEPVPCFNPGLVVAI